MTVSMVLFAGAFLCAICAGTAATLITEDLNKRGIKTSWPLMRMYALRNVRLYREETLKSTGSVGPLFYWFVIPINGMWILAVIAILLR